MQDAFTTLLDDDNPTPNVRHKVVLNVGCGYRGRGPHAAFQGPEWRELRLDIDPSVTPDIIASIADMRPVPSGSVDAVWSSHNLEHLYRHEVPVALGEFLRVLRRAGELLVTMPDLQTVAQLVVNDRLEDQAYVSPSGPISALDMIYGHAASVTAGNHFSAHKCGFTARTLTQLLYEAGFAGVEVWRDGFALWARARKPPA
ncbi:MAG: methyltransferase domain-containing protein [Alphaproteobacteria bacterium]|nr:methyltransferase domain-containing protein [Alphaproteobacteria bacterium]